MIDLIKSLIKKYYNKKIDELSIEDEDLTFGEIFYKNILSGYKTLFDKFNI